MLTSDELDGELELFRLLNEGLKAEQAGHVRPFREAIADIREIDLKLMEAEIEYQNNPVTYTHEKVMAHLCGIIRRAAGMADIREGLNS